MTDEKKFNEVCQSEVSFSKGGQMGMMLRMKNQMDRTVGDGTLTGFEFADLKERLALRLGPKYSNEYENKLNELEKINSDSQNGIAHKPITLIKRNSNSNN